MAGQVCIKFVTKLPGTYQLFLTILMLNYTDISVYKGSFYDSVMSKVLFQIHVGLCCSTT